MVIRVLQAEDAVAYQALRLCALQEHPEAFGSAYEDECSLTTEQVSLRIQPTADRCVFGATADGALLGIASFGRYPGRKIRHRAMIGGMYVSPDSRGQGLGGALLDAIIQHARLLPDLEELVLAVTIGNEQAKSLYLARGFGYSHVERRYIKVDQIDYDIEWLTLRLA